MRVYFGFRINGQCQVHTWSAENPSLPEPLPCQGVPMHALVPGPAWGEMSAGTARLAWCLLAHCTGSPTVADACCDALAEEVLQWLTGDMWSLTAEYLLGWLALLQEEYAAEVQIAPEPLGSAGRPSAVREEADYGSA